MKKDSCLPFSYMNKGTKPIKDILKENQDLKNKLEGFYSALGWGQVPDATFANASKFFDF